LQINVWLKGVWLKGVFITTLEDMTGG